MKATLFSASSLDLSLENLRPAPVDQQAGGPQPTYYYVRALDVCFMVLITLMGPIEVFACGQRPANRLGSALFALQLRVSHEVHLTIVETYLEDLLIMAAFGLLNRLFIGHKLNNGVIQGFIQDV